MRFGCKSKTETEIKRVRVRTMLSYWDEDRCNPRRITRKIQFCARADNQRDRHADKQARKQADKRKINRTRA